MDDFPFKNLLKDISYINFLTLCLNHNCKRHPREEAELPNLLFSYLHLIHMKKLFFNAHHPVQYKQNTQAYTVQIWFLLGSLEKGPEHITEKN